MRYLHACTHSWGGGWTEKAWLLFPQPCASVARLTYTHSSAKRGSQCVGMRVCERVSCKALCLRVIWICACACVFVPVIQCGWEHTGCALPSINLSQDVCHQWSLSGDYFHTPLAWIERSRLKTWTHSRNKNCKNILKNNNRCPKSETKIKRATDS